VSSVSACSLGLRFGRARVLWDTRSRGGSRLWGLTYTSDGLDRHCEVWFCGGVERCACAGVQFEVHWYAASAMR
jgi:hypothetical protein